MKITTAIITVITVVVLAAASTGCGCTSKIPIEAAETSTPTTTDANIEETTNTAPVIESLTADNLNVQPSSKTVISCQAYDADGDRMIYSWSVKGGTIASQGAQATWTAPAFSGTYSITVTVVDTENNSATGRIFMTVVSGLPPVINNVLTKSQVTNTEELSTITCVAYDPQGQQLKYYWQANQGEITGEGPIIIWKAPAKLTSNQGIITVTVANESGLTAIQSVYIYISGNEDPGSPVIKSLYAVPSSVEWGKISTINCDAIDPGGKTLSYSWEASAGSITGEGYYALFTAPIVNQIVTITVTVSNGQSPDTVKTLRVTVAENCNT